MTNFVVETFIKLFRARGRLILYNRVLWYLGSDRNFKVFNSKWSYDKMIIEWVRSGWTGKYLALARSGRTDLEPNIFPSGPPTQYANKYINRHNIWTQLGKLGTIETEGIAIKIPNIHLRLIFCLAFLKRFKNFNLSLPMFSVSKNWRPYSSCEIKGSRWNVTWSLHSFLLSVKRQTEITYHPQDVSPSKECWNSVFPGSSVSERMLKRSI